MSCSERRKDGLELLILNAKNGSLSVILLCIYQSIIVDNGIDVAGAQALAEALLVNSTVQAIDLEGEF